MALEETGKEVSGASGMFSAVPVAGPIISAIGGLVGAGLQMGGAAQQKKQAEKIRQDALNAKVQGIRPEYLAKLRMDQAAALGDAPGLNLAENGIDAMTANHMRTIKDASPNGAASVAAISAALGQANANKQGLLTANMDYKAKKREDVGNTLWNIGGIRRGLEDRRDEVKKEGLAAAGYGEAVAEKNRMNAINQITGTIGSTATAIGANYTAKDNQNQLNDMYAKWLASQNPNSAATSMTNGLLSTIQ